jgi:hypothetical protein
MNVSPHLQIAGNVCVGLAALVFLLPLQRVIWEYAAKHLSDDRWVTPVLYGLIPLWLLLLVALLCVTATGGFDWLRLGRPLLYVLTAAASFALAAVTFVFIALYIRPGFSPRFLYSPVIYLVPLGTMLVVLLSLNARLAAVIPAQWLRVPWAVFATVSIVAGLGFLGFRFVNSGFGGIADFAHRVMNARNYDSEHLTKIATFDPKQDFTDLLDFASQYKSPAVREAATTRLRSRADFVDALADNLKSAHPESNLAGSCLNFLPTATFSPEEKKRLAPAARTALERFIEGIPGPNYMPSNRRKQLLKWGRKTFPVIIGKFSGSAVDFSKVMPDFEHALRPDDTRR